MAERHDAHTGLTAVILAAGGSSRMGTPKALLEYRGKFFIEAVRAALEEAGVGSVVAVLGAHAAGIRERWKPEGVAFAVNPRPEEGQLSSLRTGLEAAPAGAEAFMVCLADQPAVLPATYREMIAFWSSHRDAIVIPRASRASGPRMKRGHPIIVPAAYRRLCFEGPLEAGLHWVTHHPAARVADCDVEDANILRDVDTPEDYRELTDERRPS